ncbi:MAG: hypothetical protein P4K94_05385 [Terracidiphilus sp.]|nr:hypothetical protein [Terracidiphilus sp.]
MSLFRRLALPLALGLCATPVFFAQSSSSSSSSTTPDQGQAQQPAGAQTPAQMSVQARIRARRNQRRATAIHDTYAHLYDAYANMGYLRFKPGPSLQRLTYYAWDTGVTRYLNERLGVTVDGRGYYGTAYVGLNYSSITRPAVSTYTAMAGPTYRFYMQPRYAVSGRVLGGYARGKFTGDTNGFGTLNGLLYPNSNTYAASASILGELNLTPNVALRLAPEYFVTGFGSTTQNSVGFTGGLVYRFGKQ